METARSRVSCKGLKKEGQISGVSSLKGDVGCLVQNASGANTVIVKWQGHAGGGEHRTSNGDRVSWRSKPEVVESGPECWQVY